MVVRARVKITANGKEQYDMVLVDTGATSTIVDYSLVEEFKLKTFGEREVVTLGAAVKCSHVDVENMVIEDVEIGPRRILVYRFPRKLKSKLKSLGCSDKVIVGVAEVESAGYIPDMVKGRLEKVGFIAL